LQEKLVCVGVLLKSFPQGETAVGKLLDLAIGRKRLERLTERIGAERVLEREQEVQRAAQLTLMDKIRGPVDVSPPVVCAVMADGGRLQGTADNPDSKTHWYEYKAGLCLELGNRLSPDDTSLPIGDPCPQVPAFLLDLGAMETLTREIHYRAAAVPETPPAAIELENITTLRELDNLLGQLSAPVTQAAARELPWSPRVRRRDVVATCGDCRKLGRLLVSRAWHLGYFQAQRKAFVGDGSSWIWKLWEENFRAFDFEPILDLMHAITYVYAAATAGRAASESGPIYRQWATWVWQGQVTAVIAALEDRQDELGLPVETDGPTSPRNIIATTLTYLRNQQSRMNYPHYRSQGLPITSSHMESTIKELNFRIKGSEKFWSQTGGEDVLQLRADSLCDSDPLTTFWQHRTNNRSGFHSSCRKTEHQAA
jgi:hypothetical protein